MRIIFLECKKVFMSPLFIGLFIVFSMFNMYLIVDNSYFKEELKIANGLAETYGLEITNESLHQLEEDIKLEVGKMTEMTGQEVESVFSFFDQLSMEDYEKYSEEEQSFFHQLQLKEAYLNVAKQIDSDYEGLSMKALAEAEIEKYQLSGNAAEILLTEAEKLSIRFDKLKQTGEHKQWFFLGQPYEMHSFLFRTIVKAVVFEALILIVLATALLTTYEFENRTHLLVYATKRGRIVMKDKLFASLLVTTVIVAMLLGVTLAAYFTVFDYAYLWKSSISSALNWEYNFPYITWWDMPFWKFLSLVIVLLYSCILLFTAITYAIAVAVKNSYFTFFIFAVFFAICFMLPGFMPLSSSLLFITTFNLSVVVMNPHLLFTGNGGLVMFKYHEVLTVTVWTVIALVLYWLVSNHFKKVDIH